VPEPDTPLAERPWEDVDLLIDVDDALRQILAAVAPLPPVPVSIEDALGLVLGETVVATENVPRFRNSAMDGYAVRAADTDGASVGAAVVLHVIDNLAAGMIASQRVGPGTAIRIMTGAPLPPGANAVVRFEETDEPAARLSDNLDADRSRVAIRRPARDGDNVREAGEDVREGDVVLRAGALLRPAEIGVLASIGRSTVLVHPRPRVAILSTGDEVSEARMPRTAQIRDSNRYTLGALTRRAGGIPVYLGIAPDTVGAITAKLHDADDCDLLVTSGGVSLGDFDLLKDVLRRSGTIAIWQVRMKPGKPLAFGRIGKTPLLGLPGNPVAAAVSFEVFGRSAIRKMLGRVDLWPPVIEASVTVPIDNRGMRRHFVRALVTRTIYGGYDVAPTGAQGAGVLSSLVLANGLLVVPESADIVEPGTMLPVWMLDWDLGDSGTDLLGLGGRVATD